MLKACPKRRREGCPMPHWQVTIVDNTTGIVTSSFVVRDPGFIGKSYTLEDLAYYDKSQVFDIDQVEHSQPCP